MFPALLPNSKRTTEERTEFQQESHKLVLSRVGPASSGMLSSVTHYTIHGTYYIPNRQADKIPGESRVSVIGFIRGYIGVFIGIMEKKLGTTLYTYTYIYTHIRIMEKNMETILYIYIYIHIYIYIYIENLGAKFLRPLPR